MSHSMRTDGTAVETRSGPAPARVRDLVGYGALVVAPHPDDEVLGCGGLIAANERPDAIDVLVVTDGALSPPGLAGDPDLPARRRAESERALRSLGLGGDRVRFLGLPDGGLPGLDSRLDGELGDAVHRTAATDVFVPFRFDRHPDHLAVHAAGERLLRRTGIRLWEYFVYPRWRLLPRGDVRRHLGRGSTVALHLSEAARTAKRAALEEYVSQATTFAEGQGRPVLSPAFLDWMCDGPEIFLRYEVGRTGGAVLGRAGWWFHVVRRIEPPLKRTADAVRRRFGGRP